MAGFNKLFSDIITSSIWCEDNETRIVWLTILALKDQGGRVSASVPGLAGVARVSVEACRGAIRKFESPDADSRSQEFEGRRIEKVEGGWRVLNHEKYRKKGSEGERKEYMAALMRERRSARGGVLTPANALLTSDNKCLQRANASVSVSVSESVSEYSLGEEGRGGKGIEETSEPPPVPGEGEEAKSHALVCFERLQGGHEDFRGLAFMEVAVVLRGWPEARWDVAIGELLQDFAGAECRPPCRRLKNYLAGRERYREDLKKGSGAEEAEALGGAVDPKTWCVKCDRPKTACLCGKGEES